MPEKIDKILKITQKLTKDVQVVKIEHESKKVHLEKGMEKIKDNLRKLAKIRKEVMSNSTKGLRKVNDMMAIQRAHPITSVSPLVAKLKKKNLDSSSQGADSQVTIGPSTRTMSRNRERRVMIFIMEELEEITKNMIPRRTLSSCILWFSIFLFVLLVLILGITVCCGVVGFFLLFFFFVYLFFLDSFTTILIF